MYLNPNISSTGANLIVNLPSNLYIYITKYQENIFSYI